MLTDTIVPAFHRTSFDPGSRTAARKQRLAEGKLSEAGKIALLSRTIRDAIQARGAVVEHDLTQCGLPLAEAKTLYDHAMAKARKADALLFANAGV